jgi:putative ABC transport system permease protein
VQGQKEIDESFVAMNLAAAQRLLFGPGSDRVTSVVVQLRHTADMPLARARIETLIARAGLDLEVRSFDELTPFYGQAVGMFRAVFGFITAIMATIVFFIVINTMNMNVFERTSEIGVTRAMGARRSGVRRLFLAEGWILGVLGASTGVLLALLIDALFNRAGFMWTPPGQTGAIPMRLLLSGSWTLIGGVWLGLAVLTTLAAIVPAHRASGLRIVDALRQA